MMISDSPFFNKKIHTLLAFLIITLFSLIMVSIIISQAGKLAELERPSSILIKVHLETDR